MTLKIYKYFGPEHMDKIFNSAESITLKCSLPKEFNDPYELFLTIDFEEEPGALSYYMDVIGDLPQLPTTCFSRSPAVIPMWAHYARSHQGFVVEFDEAKMAKTFPESSFADITYSDTPNPALSELLHRAFIIGKPRYTYLLQRGVFNAAYFTKTVCWTYEQERRMVAAVSETYQSDNLSLLSVPNDCIGSIICGSQASDQTKGALAERAAEIDCRYLELRVGKSSATPFFVDTESVPLLFNGADIAEALQYCADCQEPVAMEVELCAWCQIDDEHRKEAASRNPFRIFDKMGILDRYIEEMDKVGAIKKKQDN